MRSRGRSLPPRWCAQSAWSENALWVLARIGRRPAPASTTAPLAVVRSGPWAVRVRAAGRHGRARSQPLLGHARGAAAARRCANPPPGAVQSSRSSAGSRGGRCRARWLADPAQMSLPAPIPRNGTFHWNSHWIPLMASHSTARLISTDATSNPAASHMASPSWVPRFSGGAGARPEAGKDSSSSSVRSCFVLKRPSPARRASSAEHLRRWPAGDRADPCRAVLPAMARAKPDQAIRRPLLPAARSRGSAAGRLILADFS
jgi:hypothetical protein